MTKGKYKKKRERAKQRALQDNARTVAQSHAHQQTAEQQPHDLKQTQKKKDEMAAEVSKPAKSLRDWWKQPSPTDYTVALFTVVLAVVSTFQGCVTLRQLEVMRNDERAWLKIEAYVEPSNKQVVVIARTGSPLALQIQANNTGKSVAKNIEVYSYLQVLNAGEDPQLEWANGEDKDNSKGFPAAYRSFTGLFFPSDTQILSVVRLTKDGSYQLVTKDESDGLDQKQKYIAVFGVVFYDDVFKVRHWTKFCKPLYVDTAFSSKCISFNSEGEVGK